MAENAERKVITILSDSPFIPLQGTAIKQN